MRRKCLALDLKNDAALIAQYIGMHQPGSVWPAIIDHLRAQGVSTMEIWQRADRLFMIIDATDDYPRSSLSHEGLAKNKDWEELMATFQRTLPDAAPGEKWSEMVRIFCLADHPGSAGT